MQVQSENGSVIISNIAAKHVSTNAQNPGPSGSAVIERENYFILIISISKNYNGLSYLCYTSWNMASRYKILGWAIKHVMCNNNTKTRNE